jgi:2,3-dihydroxyphenylpropionate 1,2-dioxygenase
MSTVIGGAKLPHAPEFFTMPDTEGKAVVEQFFHTTAPPFTIHVGGEARGDQVEKLQGAGGGCKANLTLRR